MKKLIWTALASVLTAAAAGLAMRLLDRTWRRLAKEPPPEPPAWARFLIGKPLKTGVRRLVEEP